MKLGRVNSGMSKRTGSYCFCNKRAQCILAAAKQETSERGNIVKEIFPKASPDAFSKLWTSPLPLFSVHFRRGGRRPLTLIMNRIRLSVMGIRYRPQRRFAWRTLFSPPALSVGVSVLPHLDNTSYNHDTTQTGIHRVL